MRKLLISVLFLLLLIPAFAHASDYTVSGATSPTAANGDYTVAGTYNSQPYYKHNTQDYYLYWGASLSEWEIGATSGAMPPLWAKQAPTSVITGTYGFIIGSGVVTVSAAAASPPVVSSITPSSGTSAGGTAVTIAGTSFVTGVIIKIGGNSCTNVAFISVVSLTATTPAGTTGAQSVVVTNPDAQTSNTNITFTYTAGGGGGSSAKSYFIKKKKGITFIK